MIETIKSLSLVLVIGSCITDAIGDYGVQINVDLHYKLQVFSELSNTDIFSKLENYGGDTAFTVMPYNDDGNYHIQIYCCMM